MSFFVAPSTLVAVSDEDELLDAGLISRYVRAHSERRPRHVDLMRWGAFKHYYIAFSPRAQAEVAAWIRAAGVPGGVAPRRGSVTAVEDEHEPRRRAGLQSE